MKKRKKVKMKSEKREIGEDDKEDYDAWGDDDPWGVPTYPGAWTANLQLPCGSGLGWKTHFRCFLDDFFGDGAVLVSIFRKTAL